MYRMERRAAKRYPLELQGHAIINGSNVSLRTRDISQGGGRLELASHISLRKGSKLLIRFDIGFMGRAIICRVTACDHHTLYGVTFDRFDSYSDLVLLAYLVRHEQHLPARSTLQ